MMTGPYKSGRAEVSVLPRSLVEKLKSDAVVVSKAERKALNKAKQDEWAERNSESLLRKHRILALEEERQHAIPPSDLEVETVSKNNQVLKAAREMMDANLDEVKNMNRLVAYAKCAGIRQVQLREKARIQEEKKEQQRKVDEMMEVDRQRAIAMYEERDQRRRQISVKEAAVLRKQISQREENRRNATILKEQECEQIRNYMEHQKQVDKEIQTMRKAKAREVIEQTHALNEEQMILKRKQKEEDREEERRNAAFVLAKEAAADEAHKEKLRIKHEKDQEHNRLLAMHKRVMDNRAYLDELRAKRQQEAYERQWRLKEKAEAERIRKMNDDCKAALDEQVQKKDEQVLYQLRENKIARQHMIAAERNGMQAEIERERIEKESHRKNQQDLLKQISQKQEAKRNAHLAKMEERRQLELKHAHIRQVVDNVRTQKISELREAGVPEKYLRDLYTKTAITSLSHHH
eukprot:gnl/Spiro4/22712_TR11208_c0_g1_i1.p1 gnl/Spiro4/22712_TR11208_c0_g1~~gnl/Spiro4/22712_TR11208_c0_g1_i1.p1  ORF type:complete len:515 (+),score=196.35 gnl/Spiro4/22712_TR11208_c0_g1_i1:156-1547(+)